MPLSRTVLSRLRKLGTLPTRWDEPLEVAGHPLPEPLRQLANVTFPVGTTFCTSEEDTLWVWALELGGVSEIDTSEFGLEWDGGPLACIGDADGGNNMLLIRLDDDKPSDPFVYEIDHYDPGKIEVGPGVRLSKFLGALKVDVRDAQKHATGPDTGVPLSQPVRQALSIPFSKTQNFSPAELARVRSISLTQAGDLSDLQHLPALENLQLFQCTLGELSALAHAPKLQRLFVIESSIADWSVVRTHGALRELHVPACGLQQLAFFPDGLNAATVTANPLGPSAAADLARLPRALSHLPHPEAVELELNEALRGRGVQACCATWEQQLHVVQTPGVWRKLDAAALRGVLSAGSDLIEWINLLPAHEESPVALGMDSPDYPALHP